MKAGLLIIIYATSNSGSQFNITNFNFLHLENFGISSTRKSGMIIVYEFQWGVNDTRGWEYPSMPHEYNPV